MNQRAPQTRGKPFGVITSWMGILRTFFYKLRHIDVDQVGQAMFKRCTSPKALYVTLFERWWVVGVFTLCGACLGFLVVTITDEQYESHGSILLYQKTPTFLDSSMVLPDPKAYDSLFATHIQLVQSSLIVETAIDEFQLKETCPHIFDELDYEEQETFEQYVRENLDVSRAGSGDATGAFVVNVGFGHTEPDECIAVVDAILKTYRAYANESLLFDQKRAYELVSQAKQKLAEEVEAKSNALRELMRSAPGVWNRQTENNPHQKRVEVLEDELNTLEIQRLSLASRIEIMNQTHDPETGKPLSDIARLALIDEDHVERLKLLTGIRYAERHEMYPSLQELASAKFDKLALMYVERAKISHFLGEQHPRVQDLDAQIAEMQRQIESDAPDAAASDITKPSAGDIVDAYCRMLDKEHSAVLLKIQFLRSKIQQELDKSRELTDFAIKAKHLETDYDRSLQMYETVLSSTTKQSLLQEYGNFISEVVSRPEKAELTWPIVPVILGLCTILGIFVGSFLALALDLIAYTPLRSAFWFMPSWLLGGNVAETTSVSELSQASTGHHEMQKGVLAGKNSHD